MKKLLFIIIMLLIALFGGAYYVYVDRTNILSRIISKKMGTPVYIKKIDIEKTYFTIEGLKIYNPEQSRIPVAMEVGTIKVITPYFNYCKNPIVIQRIQMAPIYVSIEFYDKKRTKGNWVTLMNNIHEDHYSFFSIDRTAIIKKLRLYDISIDLLFAGQKVNRLSPIRELKFDNVNSERGIPTEEITEIIVQKMMDQIFILKGLKTIFDAVIDVPKDIIETIFKPFTLFGKKKKTRKQERQQAPAQKEEKYVPPKECQRVSKEKQ